MVKKEIQSKYSKTSKIHFSSTVLSVQRTRLVSARPESPTPTGPVESASTVKDQSAAVDNMGWKVVIRHNETNEVTEVFAKTIAMATGTVHFIPVFLIVYLCPLNNV